MPFTLRGIKLNLWLRAVEFFLTIVLYLQILKTLDNRRNSIVSAAKVRRGLPWSHVTIILVFHLSKLRHKLRATSISLAGFLTRIYLVLVIFWVALAILLWVRILNLVCYDCSFRRFYWLGVRGLFLTTKSSWLSWSTSILCLFRRGSIRKPRVCLRFAWESHNYIFIHHIHFFSSFLIFGFIITK